MESKKVVCNLGRLLERRGWTQARLAIEAGVNEHTISKWRHGEVQQVTLSVAGRICQVMDCTMADLFPVEVTSANK